MSVGPVAPKKRKSPHKALLDSAREFYVNWLAAQHGKCALCKRPEPDNKKLDLDHDHAAMHIRGLLCWRCNKFLHGWMTPEWLRAAADYVEEGAALHVGDYVELRKYIPRSGIRVGARGTVVKSDDNWAVVEQPSGSRFEAPINNLSRLVRAEYL